MGFEEKHPIILHKGSYVSRLIIGHYHDLAAHQNRGMTLTEIRSVGYWITGAHAMIAFHIHHFITCRKPRGQYLHQQMAPLPVDETEPAPPFSYIGIDCFEPFMVKDGRKEAKRWGLLATCMATRAVHIELLADITSDTLLNALTTLTFI